MKVEVIAWLTLVGLHFNSVHGCECSGRPEVVKECQNSTQNNFLETCICDGVISVNWQNCLPEPDDWVGIYACKGENHTKYDYSDLTRIHTGSLSAGGLNFSEPPPAFKCICLVAVMNRVDSGSTSQYDLLILEGDDFIVPDSDCTVGSTPFLSTTVQSESTQNVTDSAMSPGADASVTTSPAEGGTSTPFAVPAASPLDDGTMTPVDSVGSGPPATSNPFLVGTEAPMKGDSTAPVSAPVVETPHIVLVGAEAPVETAAPISASVSETPPIFFVGAEAPVENNTIAPVSTPVADVRQTISPAKSPTPAVPVIIAPIPTGSHDQSNTGAPIGSPVILVEGSTDKPFNATMTAGSVQDGTGAPVVETPAEPECTGIDEDPYQFWGNGSFIPCCTQVDQCLSDWNSNGRGYFRCVASGNCPPTDPDHPIQPYVPPAVCTDLNEDPYEVHGDGTVIPCCNPSKQCLKTWDNDGRSYFRCVSDCDTAEIGDPTCTVQDQDPFQGSVDGTEKQCCPGLSQCLDNWNEDDRYYYRCLFCCGEKCTETQKPSPTSFKTGVRSDQLSNFVVKPGEVGVFVSKSSISTSGAMLVDISFLGLLVGLSLLIH